MERLPSLPHIQMRVSVMTLVLLFALFNVSPEFAQLFRNSQDPDPNIHNPSSMVQSLGMLEPSSSSAEPIVSIVGHFDKTILDHFSVPVPLRGIQDEFHHLITHAALAGGTLMYLLIMPSAQEQLRSTGGGVVPWGPHFCIDRFGSLVNQIMPVVRAIPPEGMAGQIPYLAYAATAILYLEIKHFNALFRKSPIFTEAS